MHRPEASSVAEHFLQMLRNCPQREIFAIASKEGERSSFTWSGLLGEAASRARTLSTEGIRPGEIVPIMREFSPLLVLDFLGTILAGAMPCIVAPPNAKVSDDVLMRKLRGMLGSKGLDRIVCDESLAPVLLRTVGMHIAGFRCITDGSVEREDPTPWLSKLSTDAEAPIFLQHSSGTSGVPKAVVVRNRQLISQLRTYASSLEVTNDDRVASWLPLYHDMGMVACLWGSLLWNIPATHIRNFDWLLRPMSLIDLIADDRSTLCWLPNFAFSYLAKAAAGHSFAGDELASIRAWVNCSEPVKHESFQAFTGAFKNAGVREESLSASYAMAENIFAVTQTSPHHRPTTLEVDRQLLEEAHRIALAKGDTPSRSVVSSGRVVKGTEVRIQLADGTIIGSDNLVGDIVLQGDCMLDAYYANEEDTKRSLVDGWYHTGDVGFLREGELYVIGRSKDMLIVAGRNIDPTEIEYLINGVEGAIPGRSCCIGIYNELSGTEEIHLVVETKLPSEARQSLALTCKKRIKTETDFQLRQVWCVDKGWLVKSTSGKIARNENREKLLANFIQPESDRP